jgi:predicted phage-related endonuclease
MADSNSAGGDIYHRDGGSMSAPTIAGELDRALYIGGSDIAAIMGLGAYGHTALTTYLKKIGELNQSIDDDTRLFLDRRKRWEGPIVEMLHEDFDAEIIGVNRRYRDAEYDFFAAEIDYEWRDETGIQNGEIKTVSAFAWGERHGWGEPGTADVPVHYAAQVMWGLGVTGRQTCILAALVGLDNMLFYRIERDDAVIAEMRARALLFWRDNIQARVPPEPETLRDVLYLTSRLHGRPVELSAEARERLEQIRAVRNNIKALKDDEEALEFELFDFIRKQWQKQAADANALAESEIALLSEGKRLATWNMQRRSSIDTKALRIEHPDLAAKYTRVTESRTLRLNKIN